MKLYYAFIFIISTVVINAEIVEIKKDVPFVMVSSYGKKVKIERSSKENSHLTNTYARTSRPSPPFFIQPFEVAKGVDTYGELEVLDFIEKRRGIFVDARLRNWYEKSAIASSVNIPFKIFLKDSDKLTRILKKFAGKKGADGKWNFDKAPQILFYCNGAWCGQSPTAINALIKLGYPKSKMKYYRGGMQSWQLLGLSTIVPKGRR